MSLTVDVLSVKGEKVDSVSLADSVFGAKPSSALVHEVVTAHLANMHRGTHSTKTRGEVSGGGVKPWKQKHTGNARAGSTRSPLWRHGGIIFGPKPHQGYHKPVSSAKRRLALRMVLSDFVREGRLKVLDGFQVAEPKTKKVVEIVRKLGLPEKSVVVVDQVEETTARASRNFPGIQICRAKDLNSYGALLASQLVFTRPALAEITKRLDDQARDSEN